MRWKVVLAFAAVYLIWGSTYLAIRFAIETLPPFGMAGVRFVFAGAVLCVWARRRGAAAPGAAHWRSAVAVGALMLLGGNGGVVWAEHRVPSGLAALLIATVPLWMALLEWWHGEARPTLRTFVGLATGLVGVGLLVTASGAAGGRAVDPAGAAVLVLAALSWALGSLRARHALRPGSPMLATGMQMLAGGCCLAAASLARGEWARFDPGAVSLRSILAVAYLGLFGSLVGFTAYVWLLHHTTPTRAATYAFVNPLVAVLLGWWLAGETLGLRALVAAGVLVTAVVLIVTSRRPAAGACDLARAPAGNGPVPERVQMRAR